jgi:hypothetical protein
MLITRNSLKKPEATENDISVASVLSSENEIIENDLKINVEQVKELETEKPSDNNLLNALCVVCLGSDDFELYTKSVDIISKNVKRLELIKRIHELEKELSDLEKD